MDHFVLCKEHHNFESDAMTMVVALRNLQIGLTRKGKPVIMSCVTFLMDGLKKNLLILQQALSHQEASKMGFSYPCTKPSLSLSQP